MAFAVGQKVVCIRADNTDAYGDQELTLNSIYTVRAYGHFNWFWVKRQGPAVWLEGFKRDESHICADLSCTIPGLSDLLSDIPFGASRFRPLTEQKTDISIFEKLLTSAPETV